MTRDQIETAIREGIPFVIKMADGEKYQIADRYRVALGKTTVIVVGDITNDDGYQLLREEIVEDLPNQLLDRMTRSARLIWFQSRVVGALLVIGQLCVRGN